MSARRVIAIVVLVLSVTIALTWRDLGLGALGIVLFYLSVVMGVAALAALLFNLRWTGPESTEDGFTLPQPVNLIVATIGMAFFAICPLVVIARSVQTGTITPITTSTEYVFATAPLGFLLVALSWLVMSLAFFWLIVQVWRPRKAGGEKTSGSTEQPAKK